MILKAPFPWFGGKSRAAPLIWERLGNPRHFIEPFAGSLAALLGRPDPPAIETANDADAYLANFWRATKEAPEEVAAHADWPVNEADLHARHRWLVGQSEFRERMMADPEFYDTRIAGWWVWGLSCWIGSGWCDTSRFGRDEGARPDLGDRKSGSGRGVHQKRPLIHGDRLGHGVHRRQTPVLVGGGSGTRGSTTSPGRGIHGKRPILTGNGGSMAGVQRRVPQLSKTPTGTHRLSAKRPGPQNTGAFGTLGAPGDNDLTAWFRALRNRLRRVRVCCGDWSRVVTPAVLGAGGGVTAVLLDPPYDTGRRASNLYAVDVAGLAEAVRQWAADNGDNPRLRIALCGLEAEHAMPEGWEAVSWRTRGGYGNQDGGDGENRREVVWFSPHCVRQGTLFDHGGQSEGLEVVS